MDLPKRKSNRLPDFNYSQYGSYFLTLCTKNKLPLLCKIQKGTIFEPPAVLLSQYGEIVQQKILSISKFYPDVEVDKYVVMPNHIHIILSIFSDEARSQTPANSKIPTLISSFKRFTNKDSGTDLWQRSYYDHVIRNQTDYDAIWKYIDENPYKWTEDRFYIPEYNPNSPNNR